MFRDSHKPIGQPLLINVDLFSYLAAPENGW